MNNNANSKKVRTKINKTGVIIISLIVLSIGMICFGIYNGLSSKNKEKTEIEKKGKKADTELTNQEKNYYKEIVTKLSSNFAKYFKEGFDKISNQELLYFALKENGFKESISSNEVESVIKKYFGIDCKIVHEDVKDSTSNVIYSFKNNQYKMSNNYSISSENNQPNSYPFYIYGSKDKDVVLVYYDILYDSTCTNTCSFYGYPFDQKKVIVTIDSKDGKVDEKLLYTDEIAYEIDERVPVTYFYFNVKGNTFHKIDKIIFDEV